MARRDDLWENICSFANLLLAYRRAALGKRGRPAAALFEFKLEENLFALQDELRGGSYRPGPYTSFYIHDPKKRLISAAPFRDRVVHHALCNQIEPLFERHFIFDTYANRLGKGTHRALDRCTHYLRRFQYVLPMDIRQFFPSIDHAILAEILAGWITSRPTLDLCARILASGQGVLAGEYDMVYFPGDDLLAAARPRGLPIGNLTSQLWANLYLNGLDHFVKRELKCRGYVRYVDDFLLFSDSKEELHGWRRAVVERLADLRLTLHAGSAQPRPSRTGVPFLGWQVFPDHRRLKRPKVISARRRLKSWYRAYRAGEIGRERMRASILGWVNHARYGDTWGLRRAILRRIVL